jgi:hypothetical protein
MEFEPWCDRGSRGVARQETARQCHGARDGHAQLTVESANQGDMIHPTQGDSSSDALSRTFDSRDGKVRQEVIDPFRISTGCMSSDFNVVEPGHNILKYKDTEFRVAGRNYPRPKG